MEEIKTTELKGADSFTLAKRIVAVLIEKQALDIRLYCVKDESSITDFYVNATGKSSTHLASLADDVAYMTESNGRSPERIEGRSGNSWYLIDYSDVIVNVFDKPSRDFYNFDRLMPESGRIDISDIEKEVDEKFKIKSIED